MSSPLEAADRLASLVGAAYQDGRLRDGGEVMRALLDYAAARHGERAAEPYTPRIGDIVTPDTIGALPVGTVIRTERRGPRGHVAELTSTRVAPGAWDIGGWRLEEDELIGADDGHWRDRVVTIKALPEVDRG